MKVVCRNICMMACAGVLTMTVACCNNKQDNAEARRFNAEKGAKAHRPSVASSVPLPKAWPRLPIEKSDEMVSVADLPVNVRINPQTTYVVEKTDPVGLTVKYPAAGADIYYTFIPANEKNVEEIIALRQQRIRLNLNGVPSQTYYGTTPSGNDEAILVVATSGTQTPVQLLAKTNGYIISATAFIHDPYAAVRYDSIAPLYDVLSHDMEKTLSDFKFEK